MLHALADLLTAYQRVPLVVWDFVTITIPRHKGNGVQRKLIVYRDNMHYLCKHHILATCTTVLGVLGTHISHLQIMSRAVLPV